MPPTSVGSAGEHLTTLGADASEGIETTVRNVVTLLVIELNRLYAEYGPASFDLILRDHVTSPIGFCNGITEPTLGEPYQFDLSGRTGIPSHSLQYIVHQGEPPVLYLRSVGNGREVITAPLSLDPNAEWIICEPQPGVKPNIDLGDLINSRELFDLGLLVTRKNDAIVFADIGREPILQNTS